MARLHLTLPYPPSANRQWRAPGGRVKLSKAARVYRENVYAAVVDQRAKTIQGRVSLVVAAYPPDRRKRDLDNIACKALGDALQHAGVLADDSQIVEIHAAWGKLDRPHGRLEVVLTPLDVERDAPEDARRPLTLLLHAATRLRDLDGELGRRLCGAERREAVLMEMVARVAEMRFAVEDLAAEVAAGYRTAVADP